MQRLTGEYPAAAASLTQALQLSRDLGDRRGHAWALNQLGMVQDLTGDYPAAASLTRALQLSRDLGDRRGQAWALADLGVCTSSGTSQDRWPASWWSARSVPAGRCAVDQAILS